MIKFAVATGPQPVKDRLLLVISYVLGFGIAGLAVVQMIGFQHFVPALRSYGVAGYRGTLALAIVILGFEIFSVPFWLRLPLSRAARAASALFAVLTPFVWTALTFIVFVKGATVPDAGYFGGYLHLKVGILVLVLDVVWIVLVGLSFGGLGGRQAFKLKG